MADYNDVDQINKLYTEQETLSKAIDALDNYDGTISNFTVQPVFGAGTMPQGNIMSVIVHTVDPKQNLMAACHASCVQRYNTINQELRDLGVTNTPPDQAGGPKEE